MRPRPPTAATLGKYKLLQWSSRHSCNALMQVEGRVRCFVCGDVGHVNCGSSAITCAEFSGLLEALSQCLTTHYFPKCQKWGGCQRFHQKDFPFGVSNNQICFESITTLIS
eukprot:2292086-Amphidinium_carterae.1